MALATFAGIVSAFDVPARQSLQVELVGKEDLLDAIALNSSGFNLARIIGPAIAAFIIAHAGLAWCFGVNALSYFAVLIGLLMIRLPDAPARRVGTSPLKDVWRSLVYMSRTREVSALSAWWRCLGVRLPIIVLMPSSRGMYCIPTRRVRILLTCVEWRDRGRAAACDIRAAHAARVCWSAARTRSPF